MRSLRFHGPGDLRLETVESPSPRVGDVVVTVEACGVCGSDLHFLDGSAVPRHTPITLGHEVAGRVEDPGRSSFAVGDPVVLDVGAFCGRCPRCREARPNLCQRAVILGIGIDGGLADQVTVPSRMVVARPDTLPAAVAATAVDAGATAHHAMTRAANVGPGMSVLIVGIGGLGGYGVQIARNLGAAPVIAADVDAAALARAADLGADETVLMEPGRSLGRAVKLLTDGGVDVAVEFVGRAATVDAAVKSLRPAGKAVVVGVGTEPLVTLPPVLWSNHEYTLTGSYGSLPGDTGRVLAALADGSLQPPPIRPVPLDEAVPVILAMSRGEHPVPGGRLVVIPGSDGATVLG